MHAHLHARANARAAHTHSGTGLYNYLHLRRQAMAERSSPPVPDHTVHYRTGADICMCRDQHPRWTTGTHTHTHSHSSSLSLSVLRFLSLPRPHMHTHPLTHTCAAQVAVWCAAAEGGTSLGAVTRLLRGYRMCCHYGDTADENEGMDDEGLRIASTPSPWAACAWSSSSCARVTPSPCGRFTRASASTLRALRRMRC